MNKLMFGKSLLTGLSLFSLSSVLSAQTYINHSFENTNTATSTPYNWNNFNESTIAEGSSTTYLPGWSITRETSGNTGVKVFTGNGSTSHNPYKISSGASSAAANSPYFAVDGDYYLGIYSNDFSNSTGITTTTASLQVSGLTSGQTYEVSYYYSSNGYQHDGKYEVKLNLVEGSNNLNSHTLYSFDGTAGSDLQKDSNNYLYTPWEKGTATFTASGSSTMLDFVGIMQGGPSQLMLDNISISPVPFSVPEPSSTLLLGAGLVSSLLLRRRR